MTQPTHEGASATPEAIQTAFQEGIDLGLRLARLCLSDAADYEETAEDGGPVIADRMRKYVTVLSSMPITYPPYAGAQ
ncbi:MULTISPECIES: hypothetical protein [Mycobacteroides]|jgi:hypothetical protein|uniref:Uncharacterized protein n=2 Tax=Mycobacteroides TaxID=670516 RepID=A0ABR5LTI4_9MYCO|nr:MULTISPECIES: hypothetical protein [Mycobacteroides]KPG34352.1 hypothetical protein AN912_11510 [Mycobacteroides immunogenum]ORB55297.1 hypothetical protein BST43_15645 [Mycobacteroides saopaulense]SKR65411.1 Uncharacterised protein [Mycobacteroides abscessus subsp. abscessus]SLH53217.1 Uncharacterised protein [Mycobacteroides abscessus subsp. massiliense]